MPVSFFIKIFGPTTHPLAHCGSHAERLHLSFNGRAMAQAVSSRPLTVEIMVRSHFSPCKI